MLLRSASSPILGSINPILSQSEALKELESESSLSRCKSAKLSSSSCSFGSGTRDLEAELHKSPPKSFKPTHKIAVVVDSMGSEKPSILGRKNDVLRPGGRGEGEGSGSSPMANNSQSVSKTEDGAMYIAKGFGIGGGNQEVSKADTVSDSTEVYYQKMLEENPGNSLLLRNYAKFLHEVQGNLAKAEEYYERAILASPGDGEVLSLYAKLIWEVRRDVPHAEAYFDQAVQTNPDDWHLINKSEFGTDDRHRRSAPPSFCSSHDIPPRLSKGFGNMGYTSSIHKMVYDLFNRSWISPIEIKLYFCGSEHK